MNLESYVVDAQNIIQVYNEAIEREAQKQERAVSLHNLHLAAEGLVGSVAELRGEGTEDGESQPTSTGPVVLRKYPDSHPLGEHAIVGRVEVVYKGSGVAQIEDSEIDYVRVSLGFAMPRFPVNFREQAESYPDSKGIGFLPGVERGWYVEWTKTESSDDPRINSWLEVGQSPADRGRDEQISSRLASLNETLKDMVEAVTDPKRNKWPNSLSDPEVLLPAEDSIIPPFTIVIPRGSASAAAMREVIKGAQSRVPDAELNYEQTYRALNCLLRDPKVLASLLIEQMDGDPAAILKAPDFLAIDDADGTMRGITFNRPDSIVVSKQINRIRGIGDKRANALFDFADAATMSR